MRKLAVKKGLRLSTFITCYFSFKNHFSLSFVCKKHQNNQLKGPHVVILYCKCLLHHYGRNPNFCPKYIFFYFKKRLSFLERQTNFELGVIQ